MEISLFNILTVMAVVYCIYLRICLKILSNNMKALNGTMTQLLAGNITLLKTLKETGIFNDAKD